MVSVSVNYLKRFVDNADTDPVRRASTQPSISRAERSFLELDPDQEL